MGKIGNSECAETLNKKLQALSASQRSSFDAEINRITRANAAKGSLRSGGTIREVERSLRSLLQERSDAILSTIKELPFSYSENLQSELRIIADQFLPTDFSDFRDPYLGLVKLTNGNENVKSAALKLVDNDHRLILENLLSDIDQHIVLLQSDRSPGALYLYAEGGGAIVTAVLAGMWIANPDGNYEPWTILIAVLTAGVEVIRRVKS